VEEHSFEKHGCIDDGSLKPREELREKKNSTEETASDPTSLDQWAMLSAT
jgi:hypothetical protein